MIEETIFKKYKVDYSKLIDFGFRKENDYYIYSKLFMNNSFKAIIKIINNRVEGHIIDMDINLEYIKIRYSKIGKYTEEVISNYQDILIDIRDKCFIKKDFNYDQANRISLFIKNKYNCNPEFLWDNSPDAAVFRNKDNKKWFGLIMNIKGSILELNVSNIDIINIKLDEDKIKDLINEKGFYKAYHMNKKSWITIILNDTIKDDIIEKLVTESYNNIL